jgi:alpha-tubulin suppressor-like RCC1 family protein
LRSRLISFGVRALLVLALVPLTQIGPSISPAAADANEDPQASTGFRSLSAGEQHTCAILSNGGVKCWGRNGSGQLGLSSNFQDRGDGANEMGNALPFVNLGSGRTAVELALGLQHTCALLDNGSVKCWGRNQEGQLGIGNTVNRGDDPGEMAALPAVNLGTGRTATAITAGQYHSCALLDDGSVKCWGQNTYGQLGLGDTDSRGDGPNEMGGNLPAVDLGDLLGIDYQASAISAGLYHTCALVTTVGLKCWGRNDLGQLGLEDVNNRGDVASEMGNDLPAVDLGLLAVPTTVSAGRFHTCAVLLDGAVKCWGFNSSGELGLEGTATQGDSANEMGDDLDEVDLGGGNSAAAISASFHTCVLLDDGAVKCWGHNAHGELGLGNLNNQGDGANEMGNQLDEVDLGTGRTATVVTTGLHHSCALLDDGSLRCWGENDAGRLGLGDTADRGDQANEMGDDLEPVVLFLPPENNNRASASVITLNSTAAVFDQSGSKSTPTLGADKEPAEPDHGGEEGGASVWYRFTAPGIGQATFDTIGSTFDTVLAAYTYSGPTPTLVAENADDAAITPQSRITFPLAAGTEYWIAVDGEDAGTGTLKLNYRITRPQPDGQIRAGTSGPIFGRNIYRRLNGQTVSNSAGAGRQLTFTILIQNDTNFADQFKVQAPGGTSRFTVVYRDRPSNANITNQVTAGTYLTPVLQPGDTKTIRAVVTIRNNAPRGAVLSRNVRASSTTDPARYDTVRYTARRRR